MTSVRKPTVEELKRRTTEERREEEWWASLTHGEQSLHYWSCWTPPTADRSFVYLIRAGRDGPIKVGVAHDPVSRMATLQTGNHIELTLIDVLPGTYDLESHLHRRMSRCRVRGEWFKGFEVPKTLEYAARLNKQMQAIHTKDQPAPHFREVKPKPIKKWRTKTGDDAAPITVRFVEPEPPSPRPKRDPRFPEPLMHPMGRQRISPSAGFGNR